jgi:hypothetical protein
MTCKKDAERGKSPRKCQVTSRRCFCMHTGTSPTKQGPSPEERRWDHCWPTLLLAQPLGKTAWQFLKEYTWLTYHLAFPALSSYPEKRKPHVHMKTCTHVYSSFIQNHPKQETTPISFNSGMDRPVLLWWNTTVQWKGTNVWSASITRVNKFQMH